MANPMAFITRTYNWNVHVSATRLGARVQRPGGESWHVPTRHNVVFVAMDKGHYPVAIYILHTHNNISDRVCEQHTKVLRDTMILPADANVYCSVERMAFAISGHRTLGIGNNTKTLLVQAAGMTNPSDILRRALPMMQVREMQCVLCRPQIEDEPGAERLPAWMTGSAGDTVAHFTDLQTHRACMGDGEMHVTPICEKRVREGLRMFTPPDSPLTLTVAPTGELRYVGIASPLPMHDRPTSPPPPSPFDRPQDDDDDWEGQV